MSLPIGGCYQPNPDIAGIGVRLSIYIQAMLSFAPAMQCISDGIVDHEEEKHLTTIYLNLILTGCALLLSAFIQAANYGLSIYHTLIVLNLSWMVSACGIITCLFPTIKRMGSVKNWQEWFRRLWPAKLRQLFGLFLVVVHCCGMSALGLLTWYKPGAYGSHPNHQGYFPSAQDSTVCLSATIQTFLGHDIPVTNRYVRIVLLAIYSITGIPILNAFVYTVLTAFISHYLVAFLVQLGRWITRWEFFDKLTSYYLSAVILQLFISITFIVDTELMVHRSKALVAAGESEWTFGQTLAMLLTVVPAIEVVQHLLEETKWGKKILTNGQWGLRRLLRESKRRWEELRFEAAGYIQSARNRIIFAKASLEGSTVTAGDGTSLKIEYTGTFNHDLSPIARSSAISSLDAARIALDVAESTLQATFASTQSSSSDPESVTFPTVAHRIQHASHALKSQEHVQKRFPDFPMVDEEFCSKVADSILLSREKVMTAYGVRPPKQTTAHNFVTTRASLDVVAMALDTAKAAFNAAHVALNGKDVTIDGRHINNTTTTASSTPRSSLCGGTRRGAFGTNAPPMTAEK